MKLSSKKMTALYSAISEPITNSRMGIRTLQINARQKETVDEVLFQLEKQVWRKIKLALNLTE